MRRRVLLLPLAALLIAAACAYRLTRTEADRDAPLTEQGFSRPPPLLELYDQSKPSKRVRLASYLGRHRVLVLFFDGERGVENDLKLNFLRENHRRVVNADCIVLAVSTALPQQVRRASVANGAFPFSVLSDPGLEVHRSWGMVEGEPPRPKSGLFLVDRAGRVNWSRSAGLPLPLANPDGVIRELIGLH
jgi:peroxiredoxin